MVLASFASLAVLAGCARVADPSIFGVFPQPSITVIALPEYQARALLERHEGRVALGVYPPSRSSADLLDELARLWRADTSSLSGVVPVFSGVDGEMLDHPAARLATAIGGEQRTISE